MNEEKVLVGWGVFIVGILAIVLWLGPILFTFWLGTIVNEDEWVGAVIVAVSLSTFLQIIAVNLYVLLVGYATKRGGKKG